MFPEHRNIYIKVTLQKSQSQLIIKAGLLFQHNKKAALWCSFLLSRQGSNLNSSDPEEYENIIILS